MSAPGDKAKLVNMLDNSLAEATGLQSVYKIEIILSRSPKNGVKCGAICVFRNNSIDLAVNPMTVDTEELQALQEDLNNQTEVMFMDPVKFRADQGKWISWAMDEALRLYDRFGGATIIVKAPRLKIKQKRSSGSVSSGRSDMDKLFPCLRDIDRLLTDNFKWDPWSKTVRRGDVNAKKGGR